MPNLSLSRRTSALAVACVVGLAALDPLAAPTLAQVAAVAPGRPAADIAQDAARKPGMMVKFARIKRGQTVVEILPGAGYFTRIFSNVVGPKGKVIAVATRDSEELRALAAEPERRNVALSVGALGDLAPAGSADVVWTSRNYHDLKGPKAPAGAAETVNKAAFAALKPGGYYVVLDHSAAAGSGLRDVESLHRIDKEAVKAEVMAAGFVLDGESPLLANSKDDQTKPVFDPAVQGHTDQFVLRFRKPG